MADKRQGISKRLRFEVFKRDGFKCQYCGKASPDVILHVDHIHPVSQGGEDDILNLITACVDCNAGKSDVPLSDATAIAKQRAQLEELNERREQLEMLLQWRDGMVDIEGDKLQAVHDAWRAATETFHLNENGLKSLRKLMRTFGIEAVLDAIPIAIDAYAKRGEDGAYTHDSVNLAWNKIGGICRMATLPEDQRRLRYIRGILRNRLTYMREREALELLEEACSLGVSVDYLQRLSLDARSWTQWANWMDEVIAEAKKDDGQGS